MKAPEFTAQIKSAVVDENMRIYRDLFENTQSATDPYWQRALALYRSLDVRQKGILLEVMRQVIVDSVSNVLGIIDGVTWLEGQDGDCTLTCGADELNGELQDSFLEQCEG